LWTMEKEASTVVSLDISEDTTSKDTAHEQIQKHYSVDMT